ATEPIARVFPSRAVRSRCLTTSSREEIWSCSFRTAPSEFFAAIVAVSLPNSILPSHREAGGRLGRVSPISYRQAFWLLEPELSTRIFIAPVIGLVLRCPDDPLQPNHQTPKYFRTWRNQRRRDLSAARVTQ